MRVPRSWGSGWTIGVYRRLEEPIEQGAYVLTSPALYDQTNPEANVRIGPLCFGFDPRSVAGSEP